MDRYKPGQQKSLGRMSGEDEAEHLRRVAEELGGANSGSVRTLSDQLRNSRIEDRLSAATELGILGDRSAIAQLRSLLEASNPEDWEVAVHGLRQSRRRAGWLCLESVALDLLPTINAEDDHHSFRLLVMGRTKTMDRLFRAMDGHSRSLAAHTALSFAHVAVRSIPEDASRVMAMRLGMNGNGSAVSPASPSEVADALGYPVDVVRKLEAEAWEAVQQPRPYSEIRQYVDANRANLNM